MKIIKLCPAILLTGLMLLALFVSPVSVKAACIKLNHKTLCMTVGSTKTLSATTSLKGAKHWKSSSNKVACVSKKGKVRAKKAGKATITLQIGSKKARCKVTVKNPPVKTNISQNTSIYKNQINEIILYTNQYRTKNGLNTLKSDPVLIQIACDRCNEMAKKRVLSHTRPDGSKAWSLLDQRGVVYTYAGENIACTSGYGINTKYATQLWYQSCSHRLTLLSCKYKKMGAGIAVASDGTVYYAQLFTD